MTLRVPEIIASPHVLSDTQRAECRRTALAAVLPLRDYDDGLDDWYDTHCSNGMPLYAHWAPGHHVCAVCGEDIDYPGECPKCWAFIEPWRDSQFREPGMRGFDQPAREP